MDATPLSAPAGGIRRYTAELARALAASYPDDSYYLVSDQQFEMPAEAANLHRGPSPTTALDRRWWMIGLPMALRRESIDVFHGTDFSVPYLPLRPAVMTIHDLSPWRSETEARTSSRIRRRTPVLLGLGMAAMVITPSEAIRRETIAHFHLHPDQVVATPLAASARLHPAATRARERAYFLCPAPGIPRKNAEIAVDAWRELRKQFDADLITMDGSIDEDDLPGLYSGALAFLYPSTYEGFGLPVLEAMSCGTMVIASRDPAVMEVAGGAAIHVDAHDRRGWLEALRASRDPQVRAAFRERGLRRAAEFTWERTAQLTREVYEEASRRF